MKRAMPPEAPGFMPRRIGLNDTPSSYGFRALKRETERLALEVIWAEAERRECGRSAIENPTSKDITPVP